VTKTESIRFLRDATSKFCDCGDVYSYGLYNGLEMALAILEEREPEFKSVPGAGDVPAVSKIKDCMRKAGLIR